MKKILFSTIVFSLVSSNVVQAGQEISNLEIREILAGGYNQPDNRVYTRITLTEPHANIDQCKSDRSIVIFSAPLGENNVQNTYYEQQYTIALTAFVSGSKIEAFIGGCTADNRFAKATRISIVK